MTEGVDDGFAADAIHLVANDRVQGARLSFDDHAELNLIFRRQLRRNARERLLEIVGRRGGRTKTAHGITPLVDHASHELSHVG